MSDIEFIIDGDAPYIRLTLSRNEAAILRAVLGEAQDSTLVDARDAGFYSDLEDLADEDLTDLSYGLFSHLDDVLGPVWDSLDGEDDGFGDDPYEDFFAVGGADADTSDICPDCGESISESYCDGGDDTYKLTPTKPKSFDREMN
jgi:hypothetical protein